MRPAFLNRRFVLSLLASVGSGVLLALAYPRFDRAETAWFALAPLTCVVLFHNPKASAGWAFVAGATFFLGSLNWLLPLTAFAGWLAVLGWIVLSLFLALYWAAWGWFASALNARLGGLPGTIGKNLLFAMLASCAWVALEIVRTHLFTGFPWNFLGVSQYRNLPVIQLAEVTGVYGVSWLLCFVSACLLLTGLRLRSELFVSPGAKRAYRPHVELMAAALLIMLAVVTGFRSVEKVRRETRAADSLNVAVVQPNIPQEEKWDEKFAQMIHERLETLTHAAALARPDLIVWPESATPDPLLHDAEAIRILTNVAKRGSHVLLGSMTMEKPSRPGQAPTWYNSAYVMTPDLRLLEPYHKQHLVPFGEFVPLERWIPLMKKVTPIPGSIMRGREHRLFPVRDAQVGVAICFEDVFPDVFRRFVKKGGQWMVNVTNDAWYKQSAGAHQHMANSVFRAVENRVAFVRCANTGYSCFIDPTGRVTAHVAGTQGEGIFVADFLTQPVAVRPSGQPLTFYTRYGDVFAWSCFAITVAATVWSLRKQKVPPPPAP